MSSTHVLKDLRSPRDFFTMWHSDENRDHPEAILVHQSLAYLYLGGEPQVEFVEKTDAYRLTAELPELQQDDITVRVEGDRLYVIVEWPETADMSASSQAIRPYRTFARRFQLDEPVEAEDLSMAYRDGVLTVYVPKLVSSQA